MVQHQPEATLSDEGIEVDFVPVLIEINVDLYYTLSQSYFCAEQQNTVTDNHSTLKTHNMKSNFSAQRKR